MKAKVKGYVKAGEDLGSNRATPIEPDKGDSWRIVEIPINLLRPKIMVRKKLGDIESLAESIRRDGLQTPLLVSETDEGYYEIICGVRRYEAAKLKNIKKLPARVIKKIDYADALELMWKENELREDFTPEEKALIIAAEVKYRGIRETARRFNLPKSTVETMANAGKVISAVIKTIRSSDSLRLKLKLAEAVGRTVSKAGYHGEKFAETAGKVYLALNDLPTALALKVLSRWLDNPSLENLERLVSEARSRRDVPAFRPPKIEERVPIEIQEEGRRGFEGLLYECGYDPSATYQLTEEISMKIVEFEGKYSGIHSLLCPRCNRPIRCRVCGSSLTCLCGFPHSSVRLRKYRYVKAGGRSEIVGS